MDNTRRHFLHNKVGSINKTNAQSIIFTLSVKMHLKVVAPFPKSKTNIIQNTFCSCCCHTKSVLYHINALKLNE